MTKIAREYQNLYLKKLVTELRCHSVDRISNFIIFVLEIIIYDGFFWKKNQGGNLKFMKIWRGRSKLAVKPFSEGRIVPLPLVPPRENPVPLSLLKRKVESYNRII